MSTSGPSPTAGRVKVGRNAPCRCGSGRKYKRCCLGKNQDKRVAVPDGVDSDDGWKVRVVAEMEAAAADGDLQRLNRIIRDGAALLRKREPQSAHDEHYTAYHEGGHALLNIIFYRGLDWVTIAPFFPSIESFYKEDLISGCCGLDHDTNVFDDWAKALHNTGQVATLLAGQIAGDLFCKCHRHIEGNAGDQEDLNRILKSTDKVGVLSLIRPATVAIIQRHHPQLDAIANALVEHETLSGDEVMDVMLASGWNPETDVDPDQFYSEALGLDANGIAA